MGRYLRVKFHQGKLLRGGEKTCPVREVEKLQEGWGGHVKRGQHERGQTQNWGWKQAGLG